MMADFYIFNICVSPQFHKSESLIYFHAQTEYGSGLGEDYHNTICKPDLIQISQEYDHTTGLHRWELQGNYRDFIEVMVF